MPRRSQATKINVSRKIPARPVEQASPDGTQAIRRAADVIRNVARLQGSGAKLSRVARVSGLNVSTTLRILRALCSERLLRYDEIEQGYYIGPLTFELGLAAGRESQIQSEWKATVDEIAAESNLTTFLVARSGNDGVCLLCTEGAAALRAVPLAIGQRALLGIGSPSLAILAALDDDEVEQIIAHNASVMTSDPDRFDVEAVRKDVQRTRDQGFALGHTHPGIVGVGVAFLPQGRLTHLAISVAASSNQVDADQPKRLAALISSALRRRNVSPVTWAS